MKEVKNLDNKRYKTVLREYKDKNKWKDIPCSWIKTLSNVKIVVFNKVLYISSAILVKIPVLVFAEMEKAKFRLIKNSKGP